MKSKFSVLSLLLLFLVSLQTAFATEPAERLARKAVSENTVESTAAIEELRSLGPAGLNTLLARYAGEIKRHIDDPLLKPDAEWQRITRALDTVSGQKNSYISGLYWYTDLKEAQQAAKETGKPILSLRLLGKLTDELSCANSRFFRTVLYSNAEVAAALRERFVLHWQTVRPVPLITIDFGDGRKLERTITGNSIHYVLDTAGQPIEALPGLYGPKAFLRGLNDAEGLFKLLAGKNDWDRKVLQKNYAREHLSKISGRWYQETTKIGGFAPQGFVVSTGPDGEIRAVTVAPLAVTKMYTEAMALREMSSASEALAKLTDEAKWRQIAQLHADDGIIDARSIALMKRQNPSLSDKEFSAMLQKFQASIALDTVRNEYLMHTKLYSWLWFDPMHTNLEKFNDKVYAELFLTPATDPWLGLLEKDVYFGIDNAGVNQNK
ncbi:MAG TPA: hypothetical protein VJ749_12025 [Pyrinomonadaceae bacterium]|nr:hypothetical protein [Pyrinomonadaceae bacterium]